MSTLYIPFHENTTTFAGFLNNLKKWHNAYFLKKESEISVLNHVSLLLNFKLLAHYVNETKIITNIVSASIYCTRHNNF